RRSQHRPRAQRTLQPLSTRAPHAQAEVAIHTPHAFVIDPFFATTAIARQQHPQSPISEARLLPRQLQQPFAQAAVVAATSVSIRHSRNLDQPADTALARVELLDQAPHFRTSLYEPSEFFRITDCNMSLSRLRSATSFFSRAFSSRSCLTSCASLTSMPPYFDFQAYSVYLETPNSRATSSVVRPASTCFSAAMICASVCLPLLIPFPLSFVRNRTPSLTD